jgi:hypothetical protein
VTRLRFVAGPVRRKRRFLVLDVGPVRRRRDTPTAAAQLARPRITPHARSQIVVFKLQDNQAVDLAVQAVDEAGNAVPLGDGALAWSVSDDAVLALSVSADGASAAVAATGKLGSSQVQVVDTETDGGSFAGTLDVDVVVGPAVSIDIVPGEPRDATP